MPPNRESQILTAVSQALGLPPDSRPAFLNQKIGEDGLALEEAQSLLGYESRARLLDQTQTLRGLAPGELVGERFRVVRLIGRGGMGDVYEAEDTAHSQVRRVALKTIRSEISAREGVADQFKREIGLGQTITHPNVCRIYDLGLHRDTSRPGHSQSATLYLTMELLNGCTLAEWLRKRGPVDPAEALPLIRQMADALTAAHELNIVHRDFKPGNVMLVPSPKGGQRAVVTDFGLAIEISGEPERNVGNSCGTPDYMSPEQVRGDSLGCSSDIYSLGLVAYEMVTGSYPFEGNSGNFRMIQRLNNDPVPPHVRKPDLVPDWSAPLMKCLSRNPEERYQTAAEFASALAGAMPGANLPGSEQRTLPDTETIKLSRRPSLARKLGIWGLAASVLAISVWAGRSRIAEVLHPLPEERRIAILRFENIGGDEVDRAFSDGMMQTLASQLTQLEPLQGSLSIVPASEIRKANITSAREARAAFGATLVITGSVERSSRGVHLVINLVDTGKLKQLRSREILASSEEASALVVKRVADLIQLELEPQAVKRLAQESPSVPRAYDYYLQGLGYLVKRDGEDQAITEFKHALDLDGSYALAHAGLGEAYWAKYVSTSDKRWVDRAWKECQEAISISPNLARPHLALAILETGTGKAEEAVRHARRAIDIDPADDEAYTDLANALEASGKTSEAEGTLKRAVELRRSNPRNYSRLGAFYFEHARFSDASREFQRAIALLPDNPANYTNLGSVFLKEGRLIDAEKYFAQSIGIRRTFQAESNLATLYFKAGRYAEAVPIMERLVKERPTRYVLWGNLGDDYRWTPGNAEKAKAAYQSAIALTEDALKVNPKDSAALSSQALYRVKSGDVLRALADTRRAAALAPQNPDIFFDSAVVNEIAKHRDAALRNLAQALNLGYSVSDIEAEPELQALRRDPRYPGAKRQWNR